MYLAPGIERCLRIGGSCVQELYGWMNQDDIPVYKGRTVKMMRFLGFDMSRVKQ